MYNRLMPRKKKNSQDIVSLIGEVVDQKIIEHQLVTRKDLKYLPTIKHVDKIMGELKTVREEITIIADMKRQVNDHENRLEKIEGKLDLQPAI